MNKKKSVNLTYLSTMIATELTKDKSLEEICELKILLSQVCCTVSTIYSLKLTEKKINSHSP